MPKTKEQKRAEAIERGKISFAAKHQYGAHRRFDNEDEYLNLFRNKRERKHLSPPDQEFYLDCVGISE